MAKWGGPSGNLTWPLNPSNKNKSKSKRRNNSQQRKPKNKPKTKQNKTKQIRRVQGQVRWPFGPPHLTLKPSKNKKSKTNQKKPTHNT